MNLKSTREIWGRRDCKRLYLVRWLRKAERGESIWDRSWRCIGFWQEEVELGEKHEQRGGMILDNWPCLENLEHRHHHLSD